VRAPSRRHPARRLRRHGAYTHSCHRPARGNARLATGRHPRRLLRRRVLRRDSRRVVDDRHVRHDRQAAGVAGELADRTGSYVPGPSLLAPLAAAG